MHVVATVGHKGHGKSALVRAFTGADRPGAASADSGWSDPGWSDSGWSDPGWSDPGWASLPSGRRLAFLDAPGDERSVAEVLTGLGTASAVIMVVAADEGWMPRSAEHLGAIDALRGREGLLVITRADLADPTLALRQARAELGRTSLAGAESVAVSTVTGEGMDDAAAALDRLAQRLPRPDPNESVRLWAERVSPVDETLTGRSPLGRSPVSDSLAGGSPAGGSVTSRSFTGETSTGRSSAGGSPADAAVITGTLTAGTIRVDDELDCAGHPVRVRAARMAAGEPDQVAEVSEVAPVSRVALTVTGVGAEFAPGTPLVATGRWTYTASVDVRHGFGAASGRLSRQLIMHIGSAAVPVRLQPLGPDTARLTLNTRLPLHVGDRALLRDPRRRAVAGVSVLDVRPPALARRGAAGERGRELAQWPDRPGGDLLLRRHGLLRGADLEVMGCAAPDDALEVGAGWVADPGHWESLRRRLARELDRHAAAHPQTPGISLETARLRLGLPERGLVVRLVHPPLRLHGGRVYGGHLSGAPATREQ
jgi:selenocysteine-specific elongation factor